MTYPHPHGYFDLYPACLGCIHFSVFSVDQFPVHQEYTAYLHTIIGLYKKVIFYYLS